MANIQGRTTSKTFVDFNSPIRLVELERMGNELQLKAHTGEGYGIELKFSDEEVPRVIQAMSMMNRYRSLTKCDLRAEVWPAPVLPAPPGRPDAPAATASPAKENKKAA